MKHTHWYLRGWEYEEQAGPAGTAKRKLVYKGEYYKFRTTSRRLAAVKFVCLSLTVLLWTILAVLLTHMSRGAYLFFVGGTCALAMIPAIYLSIGCVRLAMAPAVMTFRDKWASVQRIRTASKWVAALMSVCLLGEIFYLAYRSAFGLPVDWDSEGLWLIGAALGSGAGWASLWLLRLCPVELCPAGTEHHRTGS